MKNKKSIITKISLISIIPAWILVSLFEASTFIMINPKPVIYRAWETASNIEGKDAYRTPFKPHYKYDALAHGDSIVMFHFKPSLSELRRQIFIVDEYGFRNRVGLLNKPVDAVIFGTSQVAGANETQPNLVSEILTDKYNIPTYNHGLLPLQRFWENEWFMKNPPKYVIVLGTEQEIQESSWIETLAENQAPNFNPKAWPSLEEWQKENFPNISLNINKIGTYNYDQIISLFKNYSVTKYLINQLHTEILNKFFNREQLARIYANPELDYNPFQDMIFYQPKEGNPTLTEKAQQDIKSSMTVLKQTRDLLKKRGITLIVAAVPSKAHLYYPNYQDIPEHQHSLTILEQEMDKNQIKNIRLHKILHDAVKNSNESSLYYKEDSHWSARTNQIVAELLAQKIKLLNQNKR